MKLIRIIILILFAAPILFITGSIVSQAALLGPIYIGSYEIPLNTLADHGAKLENMTRDLTMKEFKLLCSIIRKGWQ